MRRAPARIMLGGMELTEIHWSDTDGVRRLVEVTNAARLVDSPWVPLQTLRECEGNLRHGWDGDPPTAFLASEDGVDVAVAEYETSSYDNFHLAWLGIEVAPAHRRRGHGTAALELLVERARGEGRTSIGTSGWDSGATRAFAARHGLAQKAVEVNRRQLPPKLDHAALDRLHEQALPHASAYELVRRLGATPDDELEATAVMVSAINDAPTDDLDVEDEVFPAARIAAYEHAQAGRGFALHRVFARHRASGELAGQTVVVVDEERPHLAEQHDTSVVRAHRGHRLGLLLKLEMLRWLRETQPQVESIDTWNAESNDHMIDVNQVLGYRVMGRALAFQRQL